MRTTAPWQVFKWNDANQEWVFYGNRSTVDLALELVAILRRDGYRARVVREWEALS